MAISTQTQNLNLIPGKSAPVVVHLSQGNVGDTVRFYLYNGTDPYIPSGVSIVVHGVKADGTAFGPYRVSTTIGSNLVSFSIVSAMTSVSGAAVGELVITDGAQNQIGTANFGMLVEKAAYSSGVTYEDDLSIYQRILAYVQGSYTTISDEARTRANADANLQAQINQYVSPSTEQPTEVANARVDYESITHSTLKERLDSEELKDINRVRYPFPRSNENYLSLESSVSGKSISSSGNLVDSTASTTCSTVDYLPIDAQQTYRVCAHGAAVNALVVAFYDSAKNYISRVTNANSFTTPANTHYIRVSSGSEGWRSGMAIVKSGRPLPFEPYYVVNDEAVDLNRDKSAMLAVNEKIMVDAESNEEGYISENGRQLFASSYRCKTYRIKDPNRTFYYTGVMLGSAGIVMAAFFDSGNNFIGHNGVVSTSTKVVYNEYPIKPIPRAVTVKFSSLGESVIEQLRQQTSYTVPTGKDFFGHAPVSSIDNRIQNIIFYGQSLSEGADSIFTSDPIVNNCEEVVSDRIHPLQLTSGNQKPVVSAVNSLHDLVLRNTEYNPMYVASSFGAGGLSIAQLMSTARQSVIKSEFGFSYDIDNPGKYEAFLSGINAVKNAAAVYEKGVSCPAIVFMQGERDYYSDQELIDAGATMPHAYSCGDNKYRYKALLSRLKVDMQGAVKTAYGQAERPLFCIYQCAGPFINSEDMAINIAQREFAEENSDVVLLPATYFVPNYANGHLSTNGYRWYGEVIAKYLFEALVCRDKAEPMAISGVHVSGNEIRMKVKNAVLPIVFDNYTVEESANYGFAVYVNGVRNTSFTVSTFGDEIIIKMPSDVSDKQLKVIYAGHVTNGSGNVRDSAHYVSKYTYLDDSDDKGLSGNLTITHRAKDKSGNYLTGANYPMWNWLSPFYWTNV